jgi:hypothetical protein
MRQVKEMFPQLSRMWNLCQNDFVTRIKVLLQLDGCGQDVPVSSFQNVKAAEDSTLANHMKICYFDNEVAETSSNSVFEDFPLHSSLSDNFFFPHLHIHMDP